MVRTFLMMAVVVSACSLVGCTKDVEPTTPPVVEPGQSAKDRAMQGMPENMRQQYEKQKK
jgi:hypothetical protein